MSVTVYRYGYTAEDMENALAHLEAHPGSKIAAVARQYNFIPEQTLSDRWKTRRSGATLKPPGRKTILSQEHERLLSIVVIHLCDCGLGLTKNDVKRLVRIFFLQIKSK